MTGNGHVGSSPTPGITTNGCIGSYDDAWWGRWFFFDA